MPKVLLQFGQLHQNTDDVGISSGTTSMQDGFFNINKVDGRRVFVRRPGLQRHIDLGTAHQIDGLYWWDTQRCTIAVSDGRIFKISDNNGTFAEITGATLAKGIRPTFATDGNVLLMANGGKIVRTDGATAGYIEDEDAPQACTHVAWIDTYFLANNAGSDKFNYSAIGNDYATWAALDFEVAMTSPDNTVVLAVDNGEIVLAGKQSVETYYNDGASPFSRNDAATMNHGVGAPYSFIKANASWIWINERREVVTPNGRTPVSLSGAVARVLQGYGEVSDAIADTFTLNGQTFYLLSLPTEGKTLAMNLTTGEWCGEWGHWVNGESQRWLGNCVEYASRWNQHLVGSRVDSKIYLMSDRYWTDDGNAIRAMIQTGHVDHGTFAWKICKSLDLKFRRGEGMVNATPQIMLRYLDNGNEWSDEIWVSAGDIGDTEFCLALYQLGRYQARKWEITMTDPVPLVFVGAEEEVTK